MLTLQKKHNLKINNLIIDRKDFCDLLTTDEINPLREALSGKITFSCPQAFWSEIKEISERSEIRTLGSETKPLNISELDLMYNLNRFGYKEIGLQFAQGKRFCIEYIITSILLKDDARRTEAIAVILCKEQVQEYHTIFFKSKIPDSRKTNGDINNFTENQNQNGN